MAKLSPSPGELWDGLSNFKKDGRFPDLYPDNLRTFWAGIDDVHGALQSLIASTSRSLVLNMFGYDDDDVDSIIRLKMMDPRIYVQMSLDSTQAAGVHEKALLAKWPTGAIGASVAIGQSAHHAISHLKIVVIDGLLTVTGSTNFSLSGEQKQDNQLLLVRDPVVAHEYSAVMSVNHDVMLKQMAAKPRVK